jgi:hypothetical protein
MTMKQMAEAIPHDYREKILLEWLPVAKPTLADKAFESLFEAYFIYIDPNGVRKENCPRCLENVLKNWKSMQKYLVEAEQEYNALEKITS